MKLSEMSTDKAADALVKIAEPAAEIMEDTKALEMLERMGKLDGAPMAAQLGFLIRNVVPLLLRDHRKAAYTVLSVLTGKAEKEIAAQPIGETVKDVRESVDNDLLGFFTSAKEQRQSEETE